MITPEMKDKVLEYICGLSPEEWQGFHPDETGMDFDTLNPTLMQFQRKGFISDLNATYNEISLVVHLEAHDYQLHGGFVAQEELLAQNLQKLLLEIERLKPSMPDRVNILTTIAANITTFLGLPVK